MEDNTEAISVAEARERYDGSWLALRAVSRDHNGFAGKVRLIDKAPTRQELRKRVGFEEGIYIAFAGPVVPPGWGFLF